MYNNMTRENVQTSSVRRFKTDNPYDQQSSIVLRIDDDNGQVAVTDTSIHGVSTGFVSKDKLVGEIVKHYYIRKNGFSEYDFNQALGLFDYVGSKTLTEQNIKYGNISMYFDKDESIIRIHENPGFSEQHTIQIKNFNNDAEINGAFNGIKEYVFADAKWRKERMRKVLETVEKLAHDAGFKLDTEKLDAFERAAFFECTAGEDDPVIMGKFNENKEEPKTKRITARKIFGYIFNILMICAMASAIFMLFIGIIFRR